VKTPSTIQYPKKSCRSSSCQQQFSSRLATEVDAALEDSHQINQTAEEEYRLDSVDQTSAEDSGVECTQKSECQSSDISSRMHEEENFIHQASAEQCSPSIRYQRKISEEYNAN